MSTNTETFEQRRAQLALRVQEGDQAALHELEEVEAEINRQTVERDRQQAADQARAEREKAEREKEQARQRKMARDRARRRQYKRIRAVHKIDDLADQLAQSIDSYIRICHEHKQALLDAGDHPQAAHVARPQRDAAGNAVLYRVAQVLDQGEVPAILRNLSVPLSEEDPYASTRPDQDHQESQ